MLAEASSVKCRDCHRTKAPPPFLRTTPSYKLGRTKGPVLWAAPLLLPLLLLEAALSRRLPLVEAGERLSDAGCRAPPAFASACSHTSRAAHANNASRTDPLAVPLLLLLPPTPPPLSPWWLLVPLLPLPAALAPLLLAPLPLLLFPGLNPKPSLRSTRPHSPSASPRASACSGFTAGAIQL